MTTMQAKVIRWDDCTVDHPMAKIARRRIIGEQMMISHVTLDAGFVVPSHAHENEQFAVLLSGVMRFTIGEGNDVTVLDAVGGDIVHLPSNVPHAAEAIETTVILDLFSPPSEATGVDAHGA
ncbi:MAG: cupin domain-containing protein [Planctomycetota bacterium]